MSLVIAIKNRDRIVLGADKQASTGGNKIHTNTKVWEIPELPGALMGSVGIARATQIIQYANIIDKNVIRSNIDTDFVICSLVPIIVAALKSNGIMVEATSDSLCEMIPNSFIFAYEDRAWVIGNDLSVSELDDYLAIGSGADVARGALFATQQKNPFERIITSIDAAAETTLFVDNGIDILSTKTHPEDAKHLAKALGIELLPKKTATSKPKSAKLSKKASAE